MRDNVARVGDIFGNDPRCIQLAPLNKHLADLLIAVWLWQQVDRNLLVVDEGVLAHAEAIIVANIVHHVLSHLNLFLFLRQRFTNHLLAHHDGHEGPSKLFLHIVDLQHCPTLVKNQILGALVPDLVCRLVYILQDVVEQELLLAFFLQ